MQAVITAHAMSAIITHVFVESAYERCHKGNTCGGEHIERGKKIRDAFN